MLFHVSYTLNPGARNDAQARFLSTGAPPPAGITMLGRWHSAAGLKGFLVAETDSAVALGKWLQDWTDLLTFEATPVFTDAEAGEVMGA
jgi:hypothetical protein